MLAGQDPTVIPRPVPVAESDGYWGNRRRFWSGGAALPAILVAASLVVVLIVVGVAQLLPNGPARIPIAQGSAAPSGGAAPPAPDPGGSVANASPAVAPSASASVSVSAKAAPSGATSAAARAGAPAAPAAPGAPGRAPAVPAPPTPTGRAAVTVEAESATLGGTASVRTCGPCSGGKTVGTIGANSGYVDVTVSGVANGGSYPLTITYELETASATFYLSVNGGAATTVPLTSANPSQTTPLTTTVHVTLSAGTDTIRFFNPTTGMAPDLDKVTI